MNYRHESMYTEDGFAPSFIPKFTTPENYIEGRLKVLEEMGIYPTEEEIKHLRIFKTEYSIDAAIKDIINRHWK